MMGAANSPAIAPGLHKDVFGFANNVVSTQDERKLAHGLMYSVRDILCPQEDEEVQRLA